RFHDFYEERKNLKSFQKLYLKILGPRHHVPVAIGVTKVALQDPGPNSKAVTIELLNGDAATNFAWLFCVQRAKIREKI
ncbi:hypothetical protein BGX31_003728, partial [Mortierella sp. GBA43]